jgi:antitoxin MazE
VETIKTKMIKIGNSQGIRISKPLVEQYNLKGEVLLEPTEDFLIIRPVKNPRAGWDEAFAEMKAHGDDELLDAEPLIESEWDSDEWIW